MELAVIYKHIKKKILLIFLVCNWSLFTYKR